MQLSTLRKYIIILALLLIAGNIGYRMGRAGGALSIPAISKQLVNTSPPPSQEDVDFAQFWDVWARLNQKYIDKAKLDPETMVNGAIAGMVEALGDPYTVFLPPKENEDFKQDLSGSFEGIGAQLGEKEDRIVVIAPLKDHPAEKAGIRAGDWIIKVNDEDTFGWNVPQAVNKIRGPKGTAVSLSIAREGLDKPLNINVKRDRILVKSVEVEWKDTTAILKLTRFGDQTNDEWNQAVAEIRQRLANNQATGLVLDLRNNPGGYLQSAIYTASEFIKTNQVVVIQENSDGTREKYSVTRVGNLLDIPVVVLINKGSASAAEILAGALRDHNRAQLVGEQTFGKGSIQTPEDLPNGAGLHITTGKWILPKGEWINGTGIKPEIEVKGPDSASDSADLQLDRALQLLK